MNGWAGRVVAVLGSWGPSLRTQGIADHHFGVGRRISSKTDWPGILEVFFGGGNHWVWNWGHCGWAASCEFLHCAVGWTR